jgi:hypothetical protein
MAMSNVDARPAIAVVARLKRARVSKSASWRRLSVNVGSVPDNGSPWVHRALHAGINFVDPADVCSRGELSAITPPP